MNIFAIEKTNDGGIDWEASAKSLDNLRVVKMILESCQMLCTTINLLYDDQESPYKTAYKNHPSTKWVRENANNYKWLFRHMMHLGDEYTKRYNKEHLSIQKCWDSLCHLPPGIPEGKFTQPPQCMPDEYKTDDSVDAYWNYYIGEKHSVANKNETIKTMKFT